MMVDLEGAGRKCPSTARDAFDRVRLVGLKNTHKKSSDNSTSGIINSGFAARLIS